jgi:hypothetical protein
MVCRMPSAAAGPEHRGAIGARGGIVLYGTDEQMRGPGSA